MRPCRGRSSRWFALFLSLLSAFVLRAQSGRYSVTPILYNSDPTIFVYAAKINNRGYVSAWARPIGAQIQGFVWKDGTLVAPMPALGGTCSFAWGLNNQGAVVGSACLPGNSIRHAVVWHGQSLSDLNVSGADTGSSASQISDHGDLAGGVSRTDGTVGAFSGAMVSRRTLAVSAVRIFLSAG